MAITTATVAAGLTNAFGTGTQLEATVGPWSPDGAKADTFWDSSVVDLPGFSITAVHCRGQVHYDVQLGATGPSHSNPCYAAMGLYSQGSEDYGVYMLLPGGQSAVYRDSKNYGPWTYSTGPLIYLNSPQGPGPIPPVPVHP